MLTGKNTVVLETDSHFLPRVSELHDYLAKHHEEVALIIINSPNNPSGAVYPDSLLKELADVIRQYPQIAVIADEVYRTIDYTGNKYASIAHHLPNQTLLVGGMSKEVSGTGLRLGFVAAPEHIAKAIAHVEGSFSACVCLPIQKGYAHFLHNDKDMKYRHNIRDQLRVKRDAVMSQFKSLPGFKDASGEAPQGAFYFFPNISKYIGLVAPDGTVISTDLALSQYLLTEGNVVCLPGSAFERANHLRLAFAASSKEQITEGFQRLSDALLKLKRGPSNGTSNEASDTDAKRRKTA